MAPQKSDDAIPALDPDEVAAVAHDIRLTLNTMTYMGISVGSIATDDQVEQLAKAAVAASVKFRNAPSI